MCVKINEFFWRKLKKYVIFTYFTYFYYMFGNVIHEMCAYHCFNKSFMSYNSFTSICVFLNTFTSSLTKRI